MNKTWEVTYLLEHKVLGGWRFVVDFLSHYNAKFAGFLYVKLDREIGWLGFSKVNHF